MRRLFLLLLSFITLFANAQEITGITPKSANKGVTFDLTIACTGTHFLQSQNINVELTGMFGTITATDITPINNTRLTATFTIPADATPGTYDLWVQDNLTGGLIGIGLFTINYGVNDPRIINVNPNILDKGKNIDLTITGINTHFTANAEVSFNKPGTEVIPEHLEVISDTELKVNITFPKASWLEDVYDLYVHTDSDDVMMKQAAMKVEPTSTFPQIVNMTPASANRGDEITIHVVTENVSLLSAKKISAYLFSMNGNIICDGHTLFDDSTIDLHVTIPPDVSAGAYSLIFETDFDGFLGGGKTFVINGDKGQLPGLVSISPGKGKKGETIDLQIKGTYTSFSQADNIEVSIEKWGTQRLSNSVTVINDSLLSANISLMGTMEFEENDVRVITDNDGHMILYEMFDVEYAHGGIPDLIALSRPSGLKGQTLDLIITGAYTSFTKASEIQLAFPQYEGDINVDDLTVISDTELKATISISSTAHSGFHSFYLNSDFDGVLSFGGAPFKVTPDATEPQLTALSVYRGAPGQTLDITITGANINFDQASTTLIPYFFNETNYMEGYNIQVLNPNQVKTTIDIPNAAGIKGLYTVMLFDQANNVTLLLEDLFSIFSVGLNENAAEEELKIYPVPTEDELYIGTISGLEEIMFVSSLGKQYVIKSDELISEGSNYKLSTVKYRIEQGIYIVRLKVDDKYVYRKILIN